MKYVIKRITLRWHIIVLQIFVFNYFTIVLFI